MKWLKISLLLLLTLAVMRAGSWAIAWAAVRLAAANVRFAAVLANSVAFAAFVIFLYLNLLPGEPVDWQAIAFGFIVFSIYTATDFAWRPWDGFRRRQ